MADAQQLSGTYLGFANPLIYTTTAGYADVTGRGTPNDSFLGAAATP